MVTTVPLPSFVGRDGYAVSRLPIGALMHPTEVVLPLSVRFNVPAAELHDTLKVGLTSLGPTEICRFRSVPKNSLHFLALPRTFFTPDHTLDLVFYRENDQEIRVTAKCGKLRSVVETFMLDRGMDFLVFECEETLLNSGMYELLDSLSLLKEMDTYVDEHSCVICFSAEKTTVMSKCGHAVCCSTCLPKMTPDQCPICMKGDGQQFLQVTKKSRRCMVCPSTCRNLNCLNLPCRCMVNCMEGGKAVNECAWCTEPVTGRLFVYP